MPCWAWGGGRHHNMRSSKCPNWLKAAWVSLKLQPVKSVDRQKFVDEIASVVNKNFEDNQYLMSTFKLSESAISGLQTGAFEPAGGR